ncbi:MAG: phosphoribosylformylglycinamidine cyclo-ligase [Phycisphaerae bacterium]|nr:phosphoribosylformylglycinamidine cyclo-ligase [Phycisphaerae bacterium]
MAKTTTSSQAITYKQAGVDIDAGDAMVQLIKPMVQATHNPRVMDNFGGFAGLFRLDFGEKLFRKQYRDPVLAACTDGVGTKLKIAFLMDKLDTVGIDLVAMSVNDLVCGGAEPLFFLDYLATGKLDPRRMAEIVKGITDGCRQSNCALLGGETAEMPSFYKPKEFDLAGFAVGVVERARIVDGSTTEPGDIAIGLASDGLHSNGYGLARRVLLEMAGYKVTDCPAELGGSSIGEEMLRPTRIYVKAVLDVLQKYKVKRPVKAMAHITGGGLPGNLPRVLPEGLTVRVKEDAWPVPPIFSLIARKGPVDSIEMKRVFNMGVGYVMIVAPNFARSILASLHRDGQRAWIIGKVKKGGPELQWH